MIRTKLNTFRPYKHDLSFHFSNRKYLENIFDNKTLKQQNIVQYLSNINQSKLNNISINSEISNIALPLTFRDAVTDSKSSYEEVIANEKPIYYKEATSNKFLNNPYKIGKVNGENLSKEEGGQPNILPLLSHNRILTKRKAIMPIYQNTERKEILIKKKLKPSNLISTLENRNMGY